jgi:phage gp46-like protein
VTLPFPYGIDVINTGPILNYPPDRRDLVSTNNQVQTARVIDPVTQDYVLNSNGLFQGQSTVQTSVYLALFTTFNSSAVSGLGNKLKSVKVITPNIISQLQSVVMQALASLTSQGLVQLVSCNVLNIGSGNVIVTVNFLDLTINTAGQPLPTSNLLTVNIPMSQL